MLDQRRALIHAHYEGAVLMDLLREEQTQLTWRINFLDVQIGANREVYDNAREHLGDVLELAGDVYQLFTWTHLMWSDGCVTKPSSTASTSPSKAT